MIKKTTLVLLMLGWLSACSQFGIFTPEQTGQDRIEPPQTEAAQPLHGQAGDVEFALDEDVFTVERNPNILLIALLLYLPFLLI